MHLLIVFSTFIVCTFAAVAQYPVKIGEAVVLDLGPFIKNWERQRKGHSKESLSFCEEAKRLSDKKCTQFVDQNGHLTGSKAVVYENGTLVFESFTKEDVGSYFSKDERERVQQNADGTYWALPRSLINIFVSEQ
ncbi:unnamed protein product [Auanema sp. JU1783]|nr:unnamed protein product [Auanema sp. JU1783]